MEPQWLGHLALELPDALVVIDGSGSIVWGNPTAERLFGVNGVNGADVVGSNALEFVHPEDQELAMASLVSIRAKDVGTPIELRIKSATGWKLVELLGTNLLGKAPVDGLVLCVRDLTERRRWEVATNDTARFRSLVHNSASILLLVRRDGTVDSVSATITRMLGHDPELVEGHLLEDLLLEADRPAWRAALAESLKGQRAATDPIIVEVGLLCRDNNASVPFELSIVNMLDDPTVSGLVVSAHNITQLRAAHQALERLATRDTLTGLPNRRLILDRLEHTQATCRRTGSEGAVLFIDLDGFKLINDSLGHCIGDDVLRRVATRFQAALRESDSIGRFGGDEFVVLLQGHEAVDADAVAQRLLDTLAEPFPTRRGVCPELTVSASIGIVSGSYASTEDLLVDADVALYEAKALGRNRAVRFEPHMRGSHSRFDLEKDLGLVATTKLSTDEALAKAESPRP